MTQRSKRTRKAGISASKALKEIRTRAGLRQADLGELATVGQSIISSLENGKRLLRLETFASCARACGYRLALIPEESNDELLFIEPQQTRPNRRARISEVESK